MHVLLVSTFFPLPQNCGKARVLAGFCAFLRQHPRVTRLTYFQISRDPAPRAGELAAEYRHAPAPAMGEVCRNLLRGLLRGRPPPLQEVLTCSRAAQVELYSFINDEKPDLVIVDTIRAAQYLEAGQRPPARCFVYLDDLFSLRYERMLRLLQRMPGSALDALGNFANFVPRVLRPFASQRLFARALLAYERRAVRRRENEVVRHFERSFLINPEEVALLRRRSGVDTVHTLKLLTEELDAPAGCDGRGRYFVFLGDLRLAHNHHSILHFVLHGAKLMEEQLPGYRLIIVGKSPPPDLAAACATTNNCEIAGYVPDLTDLLRHTRGLIAPLLFGSGVKIKALEALRLGVPLIATACGAEGLGLRPDMDYLEADDVTTTVRQMRRLCDDEEHRRFGQAGLLWFERNYAPEVVWSEYERLLLDVPDQTPAGSLVEAPA